MPIDTFDRTQIDRLIEACRSVLREQLLRLDREHISRGEALRAREQQVALRNYLAELLDRRSLQTYEPKDDFYHDRRHPQGVVPAPVRALHPAEPKFSYWSYLRNRWPRDAGLRLDFLLLSPFFRGNLLDGDVDRWVRGEPEASDHAPVWIEVET